ncbi:MAG: hypothetical protein QMD05_02675 [Candidatus Brocadiaceae bacterium]|nr:hypothetical protein [Candidatus Brocadiaceae bacterium]
MPTELEITDFLGQLKGLNERELYAGLAVLASGYKADWIKNIQCEVVPRVKKSFPTSPYLTEESKKACRDVVARVTNPDEKVRKKALEELRKDFVMDYYVEPGKLFFEEFRNRFKEAICGKDNPQAIADGILTKNGLAAVYAPLLVYFGLLIARNMPS